MSNQQQPQPLGDAFPWFPLLIVVVVVLTLSAFPATKKFAFWIGALVLVALLLPAWRKAGFPTGFNK